MNKVNRGENMNFTFINTRILPGGSTVVKTENESIYLGSNINVALFIFIKEGEYSFEGFTVDEIFKIKKIVANLNKQKECINSYYTKTFEFKNFDAMLVPHKVQFSINDDLNIFIKDINDFFEIKKIEVSYKNDSLKLIGTKKIYGLVYDDYFRDYISDGKYPVNETLLSKQSGTVKVFDYYKYNQTYNNNNKRKRLK